MHKNFSQFTVNVNGKDHIYYCDNSCNTAECKEALFQFLKIFGKIEDIHSKKLEQADPKSCQKPSEIEEK